LFFPDENVAIQDVYLLLRYAPRGDQKGGLYLQLATSYLLSKNLQRLSSKQKMRTKMVIFLSESFQDDMYKRLVKWFEAIYTPYIQAVHIIRTPGDNQRSWEYMMNHTKYNEDVQLDTILFLLEEDYIFEETMLVDTIEFFASHNPCFVHPTDYADRYTMNVNSDDGKLTLVAGKTRIWRSITSTTVTYACRLRTFLAFEDMIMQPKNDWHASNNVRQRGGNAVFFCAIPSHGAHTATLLWRKEQKPVVTVAFGPFYKDWWLFARRALLEAQKEETFPAPKVNEEDI
jgi:hypothetical protein